VILGMEQAAVTSYFKKFDGLMRRVHLIKHFSTKSFPVGILLGCVTVRVSSLKK